MKMEFYQGKGFWNSHSKYKRNSYPINEEIIKKAEGILGVKLPVSLVNLLKVQNGGELRYPYFRLPEGEIASITDIDPIHFEDDDISILSSKELLKEVNLFEEFVVLWTDFHYWVVLDYRDTIENPSVLFVAEDFSTSSYGKNRWAYIKIANNFDDFLKQLFYVHPLNLKKLEKRSKRK